MQLVEDLPDLFGAHLHPAGAAHHDHGGVGGVQAGDDFAEVVEVARGVDEVELGVHPLGVAEGEIDRVLPGDFVGGVIGEGGAVFDAAVAPAGAGHPGERVDERRLAAGRRGRRTPRCGWRWSHRPSWPPPPCESWILKVEAGRRVVNSGVPEGRTRGDLGAGSHPLGAGRVRRQVRTFPAASPGDGAGTSRQAATWFRPRDGGVRNSCGVGTPRAASFRNPWGYSAARRGAARFRRGPPTLREGRDRSRRHARRFRQDPPACAGVGTDVRRGAAGCRRPASDSRELIPSSRGVEPVPRRRPPAFGGVTPNATAPRPDRAVSRRMAPGSRAIAAGPS